MVYWIKGLNNVSSRSKFLNTRLLLDFYDIMTVVVFEYVLLGFIFSKFQGLYSRFVVVVFKYLLEKYTTRWTCSQNLKEKKYNKGYNNL